MIGTKRRLVALPDADNLPYESQDDFIATMSFLPKRSTGNKMFKLSVQRRAHNHGFMSSITSLSVNIFVLPETSVIFRAVNEGPHA